jgi:hypothetical protein
MPYPHLEDIMSKINRRPKISQWLQSREKKFTEWLLNIESIRKRFIVIFLFALIFGQIYGFTAYGMNDHLIKYGIHFCMSVDFAGKFLVELIGYAVLIYGFFAAFLIYTVSGIPKFSNEEYSAYKKVISARMNLFAVITGFIADFLFFSIVSLYWLEYIKLEAGASAFLNFPASVVAYLAFFMLLISLLGYLVFSLVMGMLQVRDEKV